CDCMLTLVQADRAQDAIALFESRTAALKTKRHPSGAKNPERLEPRLHAILALAHARQGDVTQAKERLTKAEGCDESLLCHARAVIAARSGRWRQAVAQLEKA